MFNPGTDALLFYLFWFFFFWYQFVQVRSSINGITRVLMTRVAMIEIDRANEAKKEKKSPAKMD